MLEKIVKINDIHSDKIKDKFLNGTILVRKRDKNSSYIIIYWKLQLRCYKRWRKSEDETQIRSRNNLYHPRNAQRCNQRVKVFGFARRSWLTRVSLSLSLSSSFCLSDLIADEAVNSCCDALHEFQSKAEENQWHPVRLVRGHEEGCSWSRPLAFQRHDV